MTNCIGILLIIYGVFILIGVATSNFGFYGFIKRAFPIGMSLAPLNKTWQIWIENPLPLYVRVSLTNASSSDEKGLDRIIGTGHVTLDLHMDPWVGGIKNVYPLVYIEESANIDELQRYVVGFSDGPLNYAKYFCWILGLCALGIAVVAGILLLVQSRKRRIVEVVAKGSATSSRS